jgi:hypothetical protein
MSRAARTDAAHHDAESIDLDREAEESRNDRLYLPDGTRSDGVTNVYLAYRTSGWHNAAPDASRLTYPPLLSVSRRCRAGQVVYLNADDA